MSMLRKALKDVEKPTEVKVAKSENKTDSVQKSEQTKVSLADREIRLAICVPCREMIHSVFSHNLHSLLNYNWQKGIDTKVFYNMSTLLQNQREHLVSAARSWAATHILWLDSDMSFPFYTAYKLLDHDVPIVAANYVTRQIPYKTVAYKELGGEWDNFLKHSKDIPLTKELMEVQGIGMGCMLTEIEVFEKLSKPYFEIKWQAESEDYLGEDINFCKSARSAGYSIWVDDILSRQLNHIGTFAFGHDLVTDN